jgi:putative oxidoreductase
MKLSSLSTYQDAGLLLVRLAFGGRLIYGTYDNVFSWERMMEFSKFLAFHGFPIPTVAAITSVALQFLAGISWIIGYRVRFFSLIMILNFAVALLMVHRNDTYLGSVSAIHLFTIAIFLLFSGSGKYGLDKD